MTSTLNRGQSGEINSILVSGRLGKRMIAGVATRLKRAFDWPLWRRKDSTVLSTQTMGALLATPYHVLAILVGAAAVQTSVGGGMSPNERSLWGVLVAAAIVLRLWPWVHHGLSKTSTKTGPSSQVGWAMIVSGVFAGIFLILPPLLFWERLNFQAQIQGFAAMIGITAVGALAHLMMARAAFIWTLVVGGVAVICVPLTVAKTLPMAPILFTVFWLLLLIFVFTIVRYHLELQFAQWETARERTMVEILLHDFEDEAREWLWETDAKFRITYASPRLGALVGQTIPSVHGRSLIEVLAAAPKTIHPDQMPAPDGAEALTRFFARNAPFRNQIVEVEHGGKRQHLSISAKPLFDEADILVGWRGIGIDVTAEFERQREMERLATIDPLTGLANRARLNQEIERFFPPLQPVRPCALILIDLDDFKFVNDRFGHPTGDRLLQQIALRLSLQLRPGQLLARLGGDEFALIVPGDVPRPRLAEMGERLINAMGQPYVVDDKPIMVRCSIGVAVGGIDAHDAKTLLKSADLALYAAKDAGRNALRFFGYDMHQRLEDRFTLTEEMRRGLDQNEFVLLYQPFIELSTGAVTGFEALLRWDHPKRGLLKPDQFVSVAEESSIISQLGAWVFERACHDAMRWPDHLRIAVNVSATQFSMLDLRATIESALQTSGLPPQRLEVELTESTLFADAPAARRTMVALRNRGVQLSLDDFGSGHASLNHLRSFPITRLKVDRTFTSTIADTSREGNEARAIVRAAIELARAMELDSTAEGVETEEQLEVLKHMFCEEVQGYFVAYPMPASEVATYLERTASMASNAAKFADSAARANAR
jgi:diguanylate cyclase (GGDEF)-like protein